MRKPVDIDRENAVVFSAFRTAGVERIGPAENHHVHGHPDMIQFIWQTLHGKLAKSKRFRIYNYPGLLNVADEIIVVGIGTEYFIKISHLEEFSKIPEKYSNDSARLLLLGTSWFSGKYNVRECDYIQ